MSGKLFFFSLVTKILQYKNSKTLIVKGEISQAKNVVCSKIHPKKFRTISADWSTYISILPTRAGSYSQLTPNTKYVLQQPMKHKDSICIGHTFIIMLKFACSFTTRGVISHSCFACHSDLFSSLKRIHDCVSSSKF